MGIALDRAFSLLREDMYGYIDAVEEFTREANVEDEVILRVAREHLPHIISIARCALGTHVADEHGHCKGCPPERVNDHFVRTAWPCRHIDEICHFVCKHADINDADFSSSR